jgi:hypothetical protein
MSDLLFELRNHPQVAGTLARLGLKLERLGINLDEPAKVQQSPLGPVIMEGAVISAVADQLVASDSPSLQKFLEINGEAPHQKFATACMLLKQLGYTD